MHRGKGIFNKMRAENHCVLKALVQFSFQKSVESGGYISHPRNAILFNY